MKRGRIGFESASRCALNQKSSFILCSFFERHPALYPIVKPRPETGIYSVPWLNRACLVPEALKFWLVRFRKFWWVLHHQDIFSVPGGSAGRVVKRTGLHCVAVHNHKLIVHDGVPAIPGQRSGVADCGDLTVEYGLYRKSHRFFEKKRDPAKWTAYCSFVPAGMGAHKSERGLRLANKPQVGSG